VSELIIKFTETKIKLNKVSNLFIYISKNKIGMNIAHLGVAIFLAGVTGEQFFKTEFSGRKNIGDTFSIGNRVLEFKNFETINGPNYQSEMGIFTLHHNSKFIGYLKPEKRYYPTEQTQTTEAAIISNFLGDTYIVLGEGNYETGWSIRIYFNPLVSWIWAGAFLMALGGVTSIIQNKKTFNNATKVSLNEI